MQLLAVIIPPPAVVDEATTEVRRLVPEVVPGEPRRPGLLGRMMGRTDEDAMKIGYHEAERSTVFVRLGKLGSVTESEAAGLAEALRSAVARRLAPVLHVDAVSVVADSPPRALARVGGDLDVLRDLVQEVDGAADRQGIVRKRRPLRPELPLGSIAVPWGFTALDSLAATSERRGQEWRPQHVSFVRADQTRRGTVYEEHARVPFG